MRMPSSPLATWPDPPDTPRHFGGQHVRSRTVMVCSPCRRCPMPRLRRRPRALGFSALVLVRIAADRGIAAAALSLVAIGPMIERLRLRPPAHAVIIHGGLTLVAGATGAFMEHTPGR